jgi:catechol 2,3-dioxygenase-like lactoylglutathione lyase family enzyme
MTKPRARRILETVLYGPDLPALEKFYVEVMGLRPVARTEGRNVALECGDAVLLLFDPQVTASTGGGFPSHGTAGPGHVAFAVEATEFPAWREWLKRMDIPVETEWPWPGGMTSLYFRDPAGNSVELAPPTLWRNSP